MKSFRVFLLLLIAVLLPVRGALAVAMQCQGPGTLAQVEAQQFEHRHGDADETSHTHAHEAGAMPDHSSGGVHQHAGAADKCNLCAASCGATALISHPMTFAGAQPARTVFPRLYAPPPSFVSGGQERPPRST